MTMYEHKALIRIRIFFFYCFFLGAFICYARNSFASDYVSQKHTTKNILYELVLSFLCSIFTYSKEALRILSNIDIDEM